MDNAKKGFNTTIGIVLALLAACLVCCVIMVGIGASRGNNPSTIKTETTNNSPSTETPATPPAPSKTLVLTDVFVEGGVGENSTKTFTLLGNGGVIHYELKGNESCYGSLGCSPNHASIVLYCDGQYEELFLNDSLNDVNKDINFYDYSGTCYFKMSADEAATWLISVKEER